MLIQQQWPHKWYGIWSESPEASIGAPSVYDAIDLEWRPADKEELVTYLDAGRDVVAMACSGDCLLCDATLRMGFKSDGEWVWDVRLDHYVRHHSVLLPDRFADHIRHRNFIVPAKLSVPREDLPWPEEFVFRRRPMKE